jgi:hypothetical protein
MWICEVKFDARKVVYICWDVQVGALGCRGFIRVKRSVLLAGDDFWLVILFRRQSLSDYSADYDILILRFADLYAAARWGI